MADDIRVLLLAQRFELRGRSKYTLRLCDALSEHGFQTEVITPDAQLLSAEDRERWGIAEYKHLDLPIWGRIVQKLIEKDLIETPPDLIHVQSGSSADLGLKLSKALNRPCLLTIQKHLTGEEPWLKQADRFAGIITVSRDIRTTFLQLDKYPAGRVSEIHHGVPIPETEQEQVLLDPVRAPIVGMAGPLEKVKGIPFFLGAAQQVLQEEPHVEFVISGAGPEEQNLRRLTHELGLTQNVTFATNLRSFSIALEAVDIFCLPSLQQGLGTIMLEAMSLGRPVIATSVGGVGSIVRDGETGWIVPPSDSTALAKKILEGLRNRELSNEIGLAGQKLVREKFSVEQMVEKTVALYRQVLEQNSVTTT